jgi:TPR repeat protein
MTARIFALVSATSMLAFAAAPAAAQDPRGPRAGHWAFSAAGEFQGYSGCRSRAYRCGLWALQNRGPREGLPLLRRAARLGSAPAMRVIGHVLLRGGAGVRPDPAAAMGWFYEAALRDDGESMYALALAFDEGVGVGRDPALSRFWLRRAADRGYDRARRALQAVQ